MRPRVGQREVQTALSALPLFHELLGFRFRKLMGRAKNAKEAKIKKFFFTTFAALARHKFSSCSSAPFVVKSLRP
jgi:hypothetical protein